MGRDREALPRTTDVPTGPTAPPDPGDGRATPPGSLNLRAGTRELGTRTGAGRTREAQKARRGARAHPRHRHTHPPPARGGATPAPSVPESRGGGGAAGASRRASASRPPPGKRSRTTPGAHEIAEPVGKEAERPRAADGSGGGGGGRTEASREERENGGGPAADQTRHPATAHLSRNARSAGRPRHAPRRQDAGHGDPPGDAPPGEKEEHSHRPKRGRDDDPPLGLLR